MLTVTITNTIMSKTRNAGGGGGIPPSNTVAPVISGTAVVGQTLSSTTGTWIGTPIPTYTYQWYRGATPISGATSSTYTLVQADATFSVTCVVTATNPAGIASATSNALTIIDADAQAFFTASGLTGTTNQSAINKLVVDMKGYGIWTKMKAIYPMVGGTAALHKWNLKDPQDTNAAFRLVFNGGWTHSSTGALPNGTNAYANTYLSPLTNLTLNSTHLSYYSRNNVNLTQVEIGCNDNTGAYTIIEARTANVSYFLTNTNQITGVADTNSAAFYIGNRTGSFVTNGFRNNVKIFNSTAAASFRPSNFIYIGSINNSASIAQYFSTKECAFASIGDGLTDTEAANFYTAVQAYNTTLGRSIGPQTVSDPDAQAFVTAANIDDQVQAQAVNQLTIDMKAANIWTKMKAVYPFVGGTATSHKFNLKNPLDTDAAFRLVFNGGWTHSSTGALPNGTNAFANTFLNALTDLTISTNSSFGVYVAGTATASKTHIGYIDSTNRQFYLHTPSLTEKRGNTASSASAAYFMSKTGLTATTQRGFWAASNRSATDRAMICSDGSFVVSTASHNVTQASFTLFIGALNSLGTSVQYDTMEQRFAFIGTALNNTELTSLRTAVTTFETTLSRQV